MKKAEHPCSSRVEKVSGLRINVTCNFSLQNILLNYMLNENTFLKISIQHRISY